MWNNKYGDLVEGWKADLIVTRAKRFGFQRHDLQDVQQEIILDVLAFEFDESRSNGATETTAITALIDNRLISIRRSSDRYQRHVEAVEPRSEVDESQDVSRQEDRLDVAEVVHQLAEQDQDLCRSLEDGQTIAEHAERTGRCWHSVKRRVDQVARRFQTAGFRRCGSV